MTVKMTFESIDVFIPQAQEYLINPLTGPEPSAETGPGSHFHPDLRSQSSMLSSQSSVASPSRSTSNRLRKSSDPRYRDYPSPPPSASPRRSSFSKTNPFRNSLTVPSQDEISVQNRPRGKSLTERYPGDETHKPLDMLRKHSKRANRTPHLRQKNQIGADKIDVLDVTGGMYHHEGPYDATYAARNKNFQYSPLEAVSATNEEALKATPREKIQDSIDKHVPLDGVAYVPPGVEDRDGNVYNYEEGDNMMIAQGGNYKRWPGVVSFPLVGRCLDAC